eukprot:CAMPEP_0115275012 /NCGR_PEP_ID=MMETSP0270-20121206/55974_1 /TAXON_ID=71861 /ORGANISM="Scrippsiella trochoidea, Strain CCMP3099" /LENGTH=168 /DNA_ID=CAMNT_0002691547 /DNA_START=110 /DNA_END=617 /DNA_ORIENTATION=+
MAGAAEHGAALGGGAADAAQSAARIPAKVRRPWRPVRGVAPDGAVSEEGDDLPPQRNQVPRNTAMDEILFQELLEAAERDRDPDDPDPTCVLRDLDIEPPLGGQLLCDGGWDFEASVGSADTNFSSSSSSNISSSSSRSTTIAGMLRPSCPDLLQPGMDLPGLLVSCQ